MKIQFCDLCNESVPQADLEEGRAFVRKGRVVCAACDKAMSQATADSAGGAPAPSAGAEAFALAGAASPPEPVSSSTLAVSVAPQRTPEVRRSSGAMWLALLAVAFTAAAIFVQNRRLEDAARENRDTRALVVRSHKELLDALQRAQAELPRLLKAEEARWNARLDEDRKNIESKLQQWRGEDAKRRSELEKEAQALAAWRASVDERGKKDAVRLTELAQALAKSAEDAQPLVERLQALEQAAKAPPAPAPAAPGQNEPTWKSLLVDLSSANAGVRWEAVDGLGQARDPQAVPALLPMLKDPDVFVRMATARVLGDLKATSAMPALLDALEDSEDAVREAAFVAMRSIVSNREGNKDGTKDLKFDPLAPEAERAKRLKALREWWKKEEESGAGRG